MIDLTKECDAVLPYAENVQAKHPSEKVVGRFVLSVALSELAHRAGLTAEELSAEVEGHYHAAVRAGELRGELRLQ